MPVAWTAIERHAFSAAEAHAEASGVIPAGMEGPDRTAWVSGYGRGYSGLGAGRLDDETHRPCRAAWIAGWRAGIAECRSAAQGFSWLELGPVTSVALNRIGGTFDGLSRAEVDAYTVGYSAGEAGLPDRSIEIRYRGPMYDLAGYWYWGRYHGKKGIPPSPGDETRDPVSGTDRQRAYRARRGTRSIDVSVDTHLLLRQLCDRDGVGIDAALAAALRAALGEAG